MGTVVVDAEGIGVEMFGIGDFGQRAFGYGALAGIGESGKLVEESADGVLEDGMGLASVVPAGGDL